MTIRLSIGITPDTSPSIRALLESIGLLFEPIAEQTTPQKHAAVFTSRPGDFAAYAHSGGVVLGPHQAWPSEATAHNSIKTPFALHDIGWITPEIPVPDATQLTLRVARHGLGFFVELPNILFDCWTDTRLGHKFFHCGDGVIPYASEVTSLMDKANVQRALTMAFHYAHSLRELPFVTKHHYPNGASNIFCYRFDCDGGGAEDVEKVVTHFKKDLTHQAYFFNVSSYVNRPDLVRLIEERDGAVDNHNYIHTVFTNTLLERKNIRMAHQWIARHGTKSPQGFVCPGSGYNPKILPMLETLGYRHYASFGLDYDTLPHRLTTGGATSKLWNMAFHPISLGRLLRGLDGFDEDAIMAYYLKTIQQKQKRHEPLFFYCHPEGRIGKYPSVYEGIRDAALSNSGVQPLSLMQYVEYLDKQTAIAPEVNYIPETNQLRTHNQSAWKSVGATLCLSGKQTTPLAIDETISLPTLSHGPLELTYGAGETISHPLVKTLDEARNTVVYNHHDDWRLAARVLLPRTFRILKSVLKSSKREN